MKNPRKTPLASAIERQHGMSLLEVSIGLAAAAALATAVFLAYSPSDVTAAVKQEQSNLQSLSSSIDQSYGLLGSFETVTANGLVSERLVPAPMLRSDGALRNRWGGAVEVAPETVTAPNDAFAIAYPSVPSEACAPLASSVASGVYDIRVGGISVFAGGELSPSALATRCNTGGSANMIFVYHSGLVSGEAVATTPVSNPPIVPPPPSTPPAPPGAPVAPPVAPPVVVPPPIIVTPPPSVAPPVAPPTVSPPGTPPTVAPPGTPVGPPAVPPPYTATCQSQLPSPLTSTESRNAPAVPQTLDCAAGQYGQINQQRIPTEQRSRTASCPGNEPWQDVDPGTWSPYVIINPGTWTTTSNTCAGCPAPYNESQTQWVSTSGACPSGQSGVVSWERAQSRSRTFTTSCPAGTRTLPAPVAGAWGRGAIRVPPATQSTRVRQQRLRRLAAPQPASITISLMRTTKALTPRVRSTRAETLRLGTPHVAPVTPVTCKAVPVLEDQVGAPGLSGRRPALAPVHHRHVAWHPRIKPRPWLARPVKPAPSRKPVVGHRPPHRLAGR